MNKATCKHCGVAFYSPPSHRRIFCSKACCDAWKRIPRPIICQQCGKTVDHYGNRTRKFCTRSCAKLAVTIMRTCQHCGVLYHRNRGGGVKFCSKPCQSKASRKAIGREGQRCARCATVKPLLLFPKNKALPSGFDVYCKTCHADLYRIKKKKRPAFQREATYKREYGITLQQYEQMLEAQNHLCAICQEPETLAHLNGRVYLSVDHDHVTGTLRGLLCRRCNSALGFLNDNSATLLRAYEYVRSHESATPS